MIELLDIAIDAAKQAGALLLERFQGPRTGVTTKSTATDMVSDADNAAEHLITDLIRHHRSHDAILGEESGTREGTTGIRWVVDPLDGTTNFLYGIPHWAVSIAVERNGHAEAAVVYDPTKDECFAAEATRGATLNGRTIHVSTQTDISKALIATGFSYRPSERAASADRLAKMIQHIRDVRRAGAASLDLAWTACGRVDGYWEDPIEHWDVAAGLLLVQEAGGLTRRQGNAVTAAGPGIFDALRGLTR